MATPASLSQNPILLLKTRSTPNDSYEEYFPTLSLQPVFIPVLEHKSNPENLETVRSLIINKGFIGPRRQYGGIIFTSQRAVEAFAKVVEELEASTSLANETNSNTLNPFPLYTVGPATSRTLNTLLSQSKLLQSYNCAILGADSGNGEVLAKFILSDYNGRYQEASNKPPLLFLVGEQRRDIIPKTLTSPDLPEAERIGVEELVVYETGVMESFPEDFKQKLSKFRQQGSKVISVVVFSPSGCEAMLQSLGYIDANGKLTVEGQKSSRWPPTRASSAPDTSEAETRYCVSSIGPTTRDYLFKTWGFEVDVCAKKPSPEGVGEGIKQFLHEQGIELS